MNAVDITWTEALRVGIALCAIYGFIIGSVILAYMATRPAPSVGVIGAAITVLSLITLGAGPAMIVGILTVLAVAVMTGLAVYLPLCSKEAQEFIEQEEVPLVSPAELS